MNNSTSQFIKIICCYIFNVFTANPTSELRSLLGCFFPFFPFFPIFAFFFSFPALGGILKIAHCLGYYLCLALPIYFSIAIPLLWATPQNTTFPISPNQILLAFWSMCSSQCLITQHISILTDNSSNMIDQIFWLRFCCLSLSSFWPYCKIPKSKSLEDFVSNFLSLPTRLNCQGIWSQASFSFYGACRLPALSTESKVGWLGLNFRKVSRRRIDQTFAPLPSPFQTNWEVWGFDALSIFCEKLRSLWLRRWFSWS